MRTRILLFCAIVLGFCLWLLLRHTPNLGQSSPLANNATLTNQQPAVQPIQPQAVELAPDANALKLSPAMMAEMVRRRTPEASNEIQQHALTTWRAPIDFFGKVVDENSNAVAGANITFSWSETPTEEGEQKATTQSDAEGLFSLRDKHGPSLVIWVGKEGYYASHGGQKGFDYMGHEISPDPQNPVVFHLRKKGMGENLIGFKQNYRVTRDGTSLGIDLATGKANPGGSGDLVVQCWTDDQGKHSGQKYDWRCLITVPGGGIVPTDEEFVFLAPENGYALTNEIAMPADRTNWTSQVDLKFIYRLADGRYGRITFSMIAGGHHFCMIDSVLNPSGSRNLEAK